MNIVQLSETLKDLSDRQISQYVQQPDGTVPPWLALSELNRRQRMRQSGPMQQQTGPEPSVAEALTAPMQQGIGSAGPAPGMPAQAFQAGGVVRVRSPVPYVDFIPSDDRFSRGSPFAGARPNMAGDYDIYRMQQEADRPPYVPPSIPPGSSTAPFDPRMPLVDVPLVSTEGRIRSGLGSVPPTVPTPGLVEGNLPGVDATNNYARAYDTQRRVAELEREGRIQNLPLTPGPEYGGIMGAPPVIPNMASEFDLEAMRDNMRTENRVPEMILAGQEPSMTEALAAIHGDNPAYARPPVTPLTPRDLIGVEGLGVDEYPTPRALDRMIDPNRTPEQREADRLIFNQSRENRMDDLLGRGAPSGEAPPPVDIWSMRGAPDEPYTPPQSLIDAATASGEPAIGEPPRPRGTADTLTGEPRPAWMEWMDENASPEAIRDFFKNWRQGDGLSPGEFIVGGEGPDVMMPPEIADAPSSASPRAPSAPTAPSTAPANTADATPDNPVPGASPDVQADVADAMRSGLGTGTTVAPGGAPTMDLNGSREAIQRLREQAARYDELEAKLAERFGDPEAARKEAQGLGLLEAGLRIASSQSPYLDLSGGAEALRGFQGQMRDIRQSERDRLAAEADIAKGRIGLESAALQSEMDRDKLAAELGLRREELDARIAEGAANRATQERIGLRPGELERIAARIKAENPDMSDEEALRRATALTAQSSGMTYEQRVGLKRYETALDISSDLSKKTAFAYTLGIPVEELTFDVIMKNIPDPSQAVGPVGAWEIRR